MAESETALRLALKLIGIRSRTAAEIRQRFKRKGFDEAVIEVTIARLKRAKIIDDEQFTRDFIASRLGRRRHGRTRILFELKKLGVAGELAERQLAKVSDTEEFTAAESLFEKYLPRLRNLAPLGAKRRLAGLLRRRGFSSATVSRLLKRVPNG